MTATVKQARDEHEQALTVTKILLVSSLDTNLIAFRLPLAHALKREGHEVAFVCPPGDRTSVLQQEGFRTITWDIKRFGTNPISEVQAIRRLARIYRTESPDVVQHFTIKPNLYGPVAARLAKVPYVIDTWTGLGFLFTPTKKARFLRMGLIPVLRVLLRSARHSNVFQNTDDLDTLADVGLVRRELCSVVPGSGVNTEIFRPALATESHHEGALSHPVRVLLAARLLWDKGIGEYVQAAKAIRQMGVDAEFAIAGDLDPSNPSGIPSDTVERWREEGDVIFLGHRNDMPDLLRDTDVAVLPSYHEGVPRFLLEAASTGLPLVATDIAGCRTVVRDGENGIIVPRKDTVALTRAIRLLAQDEQMRTRFGTSSRRLAEEEFAQEQITSRYLDIYHQMGIL
jgi:glycosyltransferase involved in cell wall biosynthesis